MGMAVGRLFIEETFDETAKSSTLDMISAIRWASSEILDELEWMDKKTRKLAEEKAKSIKEWICHPDKITHSTRLEKMYEDVTEDRNTYFENVLRNLRRSAVANLHYLRKEYNKDEWDSPPATVNALYSPIDNSIMFFAGILQPPFYARDQPKSMNYGGIGVVIGHEITHGFDDIVFDVGRQFDKDGYLQHWWSDDVFNRFTTKAKCIVDQYGSYLLPEANMTAYRSWVKRRGKKEPRLPGLNFSHNQLFFINFAQLFCENLRQQEGIDRILRDEHSPGRIRVIGTLQNSREFAETFGCKKTDYMNPDKKCYLW